MSFAIFLFLWVLRIQMLIFQKKRKKNSNADTSLFVLSSGGHLMYLLLYVHNIIFTGDNNDLVSRFFTLLAHRFSLKDLGPLAYFLGVEAVSHAHGVLLC